MVATAPQLDLVMRSVDASWDADRWATLPDDGNRYEVIDGVLYVSTAPSPWHQYIGQLIYTALFPQIVRTGAGVILWAPIGLFMPGSQPVQPDLLVLREADRDLINAGRLTTIPLLLVEILSPSNAGYDLQVKRAAYARAGVPEYWIARPDERDVLVHSDPDPGKGEYRRIERVPPEGELVSPTLPFRAPVAAFFADPTLPQR